MSDPSLKVIQQQQQQQQQQQKQQKRYIKNQIKQ